MNKRDLLVQIAMIEAGLVPYSPVGNYRRFGPGKQSTEKDINGQLTLFSKDEVRKMTRKFRKICRKYAKKNGLDYSKLSPSRKRSIVLRHFQSVVDESFYK